ncbi:MAG: GDSL-type esterase/lipase family protein [Acutalibacteraceae bacterium]|nr:GDSL-type esterase/lipase family protein [Acutalibacteraceae bacterium]
MELKQIELSKITDKILIQGRVGKITEKGVPLFWTGSALELNITGTKLFFTYDSPENPGGMYLRIEIDGADIARFMLEKGEHRVCAFMGLEAEKIKNVRIYREMQASSPVVILKTIETDGELCAPTVRNHKIEFIGDSVTAGEGLAGSPCHLNWAPFVFSSRGNYALLTAKAFDADYSIVALSGWGVHSSWGNNINVVMPKQYPYVCKIANNGTAVDVGSQEEFDFSQDKTDIVVVNIGTNDCGAFTTKPWIDENGVAHKHELGEDGKPCERDHLLIKNAIVDFCKDIRKTRPNAYIFWCYNILRDTINDIVVEAIEEFCTAENDNKAFAFKLPSSCAAGSREHPGAKSHAKYAESLIEQIRNIIK